MSLLASAGEMAQNSGNSVVFTPRMPALVTLKEIVLSSEAARDAMRTTARRIGKNGSEPSNFFDPNTGEDLMASYDDEVIPWRSHHRDTQRQRASAASWIG